MSSAQERVGRNTGLPVLSGDYIRGYTKAIKDIQEVINYLQDDMQFHKKSINWKRLKQLMSCILTHREEMRENSHGFFRWNKLIEKFEWFEGKNK